MKALKAAVAALPLLPPARTSRALSSGSGNFTTTGQVISVRHADGNTIVTATEVQTRLLDGTLVTMAYIGRHEVT
ncbi:MAG TPA: hypothetical protein VE733_01255 [Streptosporangiaceae bacterium]|jgi:hypothetical protein|nr:hypothetical protein [Streptosporangiaceae bacterium]